MYEVIGTYTVLQRISCAKTQIQPRYAENNLIICARMIKIPSGLTSATTMGRHNFDGPEILRRIHRLHLCVKPSPFAFTQRLAEQCRLKECSPARAELQHTFSRRRVFLFSNRSDTPTFCRFYYTKMISFIAISKYYRRTWPTVSRLIDFSVRHKYRIAIGTCEYISFCSF